MFACTCSICQTKFESKKPVKYCGKRCEYKAANTRRAAAIAQRALAGQAPDLQRQIEQLRAEVYQLRSENDYLRRTYTQGKKIG